MDKKHFLEALKKAKEGKRGFKQSIDFVINLKELDLKKPEHQVEIFLALPFAKGKPVKIGALVGPEMAPQAKEACDVVVTHDDFKTKFADKKAVKKLANQCDYFIAQANLMADIAKTFGRYFGPKGKMPNPKAGCVVPPNANLKVLAERLKKTVKLSGKLQPSIKVMVGMEDTPDDQVAENMHTIYTNVVHALPQEAANIKSVLVKTTMGKPVKVTEGEQK